MFHSELITFDIKTDIYFIIFSIVFTDSILVVVHFSVPKKALSVKTMSETICTHMVVWVQNTNSSDCPQFAFCSLNFN